MAQLVASRGFKYDILKLIELVKDHPCIWDRTLENYKDRIERRNAWEEIFNELEEGYDEMSWEGQRTTGELILNKWTNLRDTFIKTLKNRMGKQKKKYLFHDYLSFLTKILPEEESNVEFITEEISPVKQESEGPSFSKRKKMDNSVDYTPRKSKKESRKLSEDSDYNTYETADNTVNNTIDFIGVESLDNSNINSRLMNEDEAFFASLLPTVVKYSEDDRLTFRIEVLAVMKRIKDSRNRYGDD